MNGFLLQMKASRTIGTALAMLTLLGGPAVARASVAHLDRAFGARGIVRLSAELKTEGRGPFIALSGDGRIYVASRDSLSALLPSGRPDPGFGVGGVAKFTSPDTRSVGVEAIAVDSEGRPVVVGELHAGPESSSPSQAYLSRFTPEGLPDQTFGAGAGYVVGALGLPASESGAPAEPVLQQIDFDPAGQILAKGFSATAGSEERPDFIARFDETGALDPSFVTNGVRMLPEVAHWYDETRLEQSWDAGPEDGVSVAVKHGNGQSLLRLSADGGNDQEFGRGGFVPYPPGTFSGPLVDPQGRLITWGDLQGVEHQVPNGILIRRLEPNGDPDPTFGSHGSVEVRIPHLYTDRLDLDEEGRILIAASLKGRGLAAEPRELALLRLRRNGRIDKTFGHEGMVRIPFPKTRYPLLTLEEMNVRGDQAAILANDCGRGCEPVIALVDLGST